MSRRRVVVRTVLMAYPRDFRSRYGGELARSIDDLRRHGGLGRGRLAARVAGDVVRSAPRMRMETLMARSRFKPIAITAVLSVGLMAAVVGSPAFLVVIAAAVALAAILVRTSDRPVVGDPALAGRWLRWVLAGAVAFAVGFVIVAVDGDELTSAWWTTLMITWATGTVLVVFGAVLGASRAVHRSGSARRL